MPDWDKNGKDDWHDDFVFNEIINKKSDSSNNSRPASSSGRLPWWVWVLFALLLLFGKR